MSLESGKTPFFVAGIYGTTVSGALQNPEELSEFITGYNSDKSRQSVFCLLDGCQGAKNLNGNGAELDGIHMISMDFHKWALVPNTLAGCVGLSDNMIRDFSNNSSVNAPSSFKHHKQTLVGIKNYLSALGEKVAANEDVVNNSVAAVKAMDRRAGELAK